MEYNTYRLYQTNLNDCIVNFSLTIWTAQTCIYVIRKLLKAATTYIYVKRKLLKTPTTCIYVKQKSRNADNIYEYGKIRLKCKINILNLKDRVIYLHNPKIAESEYIENNILPMFTMHFYRGVGRAHTLVANHSKC